MKPDLTELQARYVDAYMGEAKGVGKEAYRLARGGKAGSSQQVYAMHHHDTVQAALKARRDLRKATSWLVEDDVLKGLYAEATNFDIGGTPMSRISAWVWIGKHLGMWKDKKDEEKDTGPAKISVVSYGNVTVKKDDTIEIREEAPEIPSVVPDNVRLVQFQKTI